MRCIASRVAVFSPMPGEARQLLHQPLDQIGHGPRGSPRGASQTEAAAASTAPGMPGMFMPPMTFDMWALVTSRMRVIWRR